MKLFEKLFTYGRLSAFVFSLAVIASLTINPVKTGAGNKSETTSANLGGRILKVVSTSAEAGSQVMVSIEIDSQGDEVAASFTVNFDPAVLSNPVVTLGTGAPGGASLSVNANQATSGRLGILVDSDNPFLSSPPDRQVIAVAFTVAPDAALGASPITFVTMPTPLSVASAFGSLLAASYQVGTVTVTAPSVSFVTIGGRVTTPSGQNLRNTVVSLIDSNNVRRLATTSSFGLYSFASVATGRTYTLTVTSKRYRFSPRIETITTAATNLDFVGLE